MQPYERFQAWCVSHELALAVYAATNKLPRAELFGLTAQMRRAAFSVCSNIAEGSAKRGKREFRRYLDISLGSLAELSYAFRLARDLGMLSVADLNRLDSLRDKAGKLTWGLYRSISPSH